jgi:FMN phosphatase YigB (HAD superfamily)
MSEKEFIISSWEKHFSGMKDKKLAIYGIGKNTEIILQNFNSDNIVGLMDEARVGDNVYGKPVISPEQAAEMGVDIIVIVARACNVRIIYRRIADVCALNSISVFSGSGKAVSFDDKEVKSFEKYANISERALKEKIRQADAVSFDIFDTLLMRRVLYPRDIFELAGRRIDPEFHIRRINAEMELYSEGKHPNIFDIYDRLGDVSLETEIQLESEYLIRRESVCSALRYARELKKAVYLVSDMYLPADIVSRLLSDLNIEVEPGNILMSCDYGVCKSNGLFDVLRSKIGTARALHVGDSLEADIEYAKRYGIDDTFHIESAAAMLEDSFAAGILKYDKSLADRMLIGEFIANCLNNPFLFSETRGKFILNDAYEMSTTIIAPLIYRFFAWMSERAAELRLDLVLLSARDGYIMDRVYNILRNRGIKVPPMVYFYTSRSAAVLAGIKDDADILHAAGLAYVGGAGGMLKYRFGLSGDEIQEQGKLDTKEYILLHREAILRRAQASRKQYRAYIDKLGIPAGSRVGFFDFVSSGTCQKALSNIVDFNLFGLYFAAAASDTEYKPDLYVDTMFGTLNAFTGAEEGNYNIFEDYIFLEHIFTSYEPTLSGFDDSGSPVFAAELRPSAQISAIRGIHDAILDYINNTKISFEDIRAAAPATPDYLLTLLQPRFCRMNSNHYENGEHADEFCNRTFSLADTLRGH